MNLTDSQKKIFAILFAAGEPLLENGLLTRTSSMNLILGIAFVPVTAASIVSAVRARREDA